MMPAPESISPMSLSLRLCGGCGFAADATDAADAADAGIGSHHTHA
jgi:hypothetical protein